MGITRHAFEQMRAERDGWYKSAAEFSNGMEYYRGLLDSCGQHIGKPAYTCDDGSVSIDVLRAKIPELVDLIIEERNNAVRYADLVIAERDAARQEADQNVALVGELQRSAIAFIKEWDTPMRDRVTGIGVAIAALGRTLSITPPAALERVRREAAAKENDYWAEEHEGLLGGHVSAQHVVRAAELREASHG